MLDIFLVSTCHKLNFTSLDKYLHPSHLSPEERDNKEQLREERRRERKGKEDERFMLLGSKLNGWQLFVNLWHVWIVFLSDLKIYNFFTFRNTF